MKPAGVAAELILDGHVHVHPAFDEARFVATARRNLGKLGTGMPVLMLAEMAGAHVFEKWRNGAAPEKVTRTKESVSLIIGENLLVLAGRQIATAERLEVIALFSDGTFEDGHSLEATVEMVRKSGATPLLPWGAGKWLGRRGEIIERTAGSQRILLGDNAGRPTGWPEPEVFARSIVLPGSDPLFMGTEEGMVGTYGFVLRGRFDLEWPARDIRAALEGLDRSPQAVGKRVGPVAFARQQLGLRLKK